MFTLKQIKAKKKHGPTVRFRSRMQAFCHHAQTFWRAHRKSIMAFGLVLVVAGVLFPHVNLAQALGPTAPAPSEDAGVKLMSALTPILQVLRALLWPLLLLIGNLMQNDLLFGTGMEQRLLEVWVNVRDVVNIFFVLLLVGIALYNVVGGFQADFHLKSVLPKFIIGLILVNFTFLGVKVVLDGINVISTGIFALPKAVGVQLDKPLIVDRFCKALYTDKTGEVVLPIDNPLCKRKEPTFDGTYELLNDGNNKELAGYFDNIDSRNVAVVLALSFEKIDLISKVANGLSESQKTAISELVINALLSIIFYIIYASSFIALFVVLLVRVIVLWILIAISPLIALMWVLPAELKSMMGSGGDDIKNQFVKHAIVPIPVAIALSIGTILLDALQTNKLEHWQFNQSTLAVGFFTSGISTFQQLITAVACVAFIWKAVFDAMKDTQASAITEGIRGWVGSMGKQIAKAPLVMPLFPIGTGNQKASVMDFFLATQNAPGLMKSAETKHAQDIFPEAFSAENRAKTETGNARNIPDLLKAQNKLGKIAFRTPDNQQTLASYFEKYPNELRGYLPAGYTDPKIFLQDLKNGKVEENHSGAMDNFGQKLGHKPANPDGTPATNPAVRDKIKAALKSNNPNLTEPELNKLADAFEQEKDPTLNKLLEATGKGTEAQKKKAATELNSKLTELATKKAKEKADTATTSDKAYKLGVDIREQVPPLEEVDTRINALNLELDPKKTKNEGDILKIKAALKEKYQPGQIAGMKNTSAVAQVYNYTSAAPAAAPKAAAGNPKSTQAKPKDLKQSAAGSKGLSAAGIGYTYQGNDGEWYKIIAG